MVEAIRNEAGCSQLVAEILAARGIKAGGAARYLNPSLRADLPDPSRLRDLDSAASRLADAVLGSCTVGVFGDYDVDGVSAAAMLQIYFNALGAHLFVYLPDRLLEGYGPTVEAFRTLKERGATVIVTVDCGAAAYEAVASAANDGVDVVILDHHQMQGAPPPGAVATVNPHRPDDESGFVDLSAAGVAFMAIVGLNRELRRRGYFVSRPEPDLFALLDLAALGLVCDVMPMTGLARVLTAQGLKALAAKGNPGLAALATRAGAASRPTAYDLGFVLGPRINAAGRIGHARLAFELLTTGDASRRALLAERLHVLNAERQEIEAQVQTEAMAQIGDAPSSVIVAAGEGWHPGVVGIVAGRVKDRFDRPTLIIGVEGGVGKGSARSVEGVDIGAAIRRAVAEGLVRAGGGHAMAAGLTIDQGRIGELSAFLNAALKGDCDAAAGKRLRHVDSIVGLPGVTAATAGEIALAGPFGPGNAEPVFAALDLRVETVREVGRGHLALGIADSSGETRRAIAFRAAGEPIEAVLRSGNRLHLAGRIKADDWGGEARGQLHVTDAAAAV